MPTILAFACGAAVYPQLLAVVVVILTRPNPQRLLWGCYLGALTTTLTCSAVVLIAFRDRASVAGSNSHGLGPATYLIAGTIAVLAAALVATPAGRRLLGRARPYVPLAPAQAQDTDKSPKREPRMERILRRGSVWIAVGIGAVLGIPGPFDLLALGHLSRGGYATPAIVITIVAFTLIKFLLIELPILSYAVHPDATAVRVARLADWMKVRKLELIGAVVAIVGIVLVSRGISGLA